MSTVRLPDFPWDALTAARARAAEHPDGVVDLSIGTPVDPTPPLLGAALAAAGTPRGTRRRWAPLTSGGRRRAGSPAGSGSRSRTRSVPTRR